MRGTLTAWAIEVERCVCADSGSCEYEPLTPRCGDEVLVSWAVVGAQIVMAALEFLVAALIGDADAGSWWPDRRLL